MPDEAPREAGSSRIGTVSLPEAFIVRVLARDGEVAGLGMLVTARQMVTCAHVVNRALGLDSQARDRPEGTVLIDFPIAAPGHGPLEARVVAWVPPPGPSTAGDDVAGLELVSERAPDGARPGKLAVEMPRAGKTLRTFGHPRYLPLPNSAWFGTFRGRAGNGLLRLGPESGSALPDQQGFSGAPVWDDELGRVVGLVAAARPETPGARESYAISADTLRLAWPETLAGRWQRTRPHAELTILHVSDFQIGPHHFFGNERVPTTQAVGPTLTSMMLRDLELLGGEYDLHPDLVIVTGDLTESGSRGEFSQVSEFLAALAEAVEVPHRHVAIIPGNHDINRRITEAYFFEREAGESEPVPPYWPKWRNYVSFFNEFYANVPGATFTPDEPWTLFEMAGLGVAVAGLNSTIADSHREDDHYGYLGDHQLRWFASRLARYQAQGWLRLAAVHHDVTGGAALRDFEALDRALGQPGLVNLLLHGGSHTSSGVRRFSSGLVTLPTGNAALPTGNAALNPDAISSTYQLITVRPDGFITRYGRQYAARQRRWIGDTSVSSTGSDWRESQGLPMTDVHAPFQPAARSELGADAATGKPMVIMDDRIGPTVTDEEVIASLSKDDDMALMTGARATELLVERHPVGPSTDNKATAARPGMRIVLVGPPGAGKGTQAQFIASHLAIPRISTGDIFRYNLSNDTQLGRKAREFMERGDLVPDEFTVAMVRDRLAEDDAQEGFLLDGFPRNVPQAETLKKILSELDVKLSVVLELVVDQDEVVRRLAGRRTCRRCERVWHVLYDPPARTGICDDCGGELFQRSDDSEEMIRHKLEVYAEQTSPLLSFYVHENILIGVDDRPGGRGHQPGHGRIATFRALGTWLNMTA